MRKICGNGDSVTLEFMIIIQYVYIDLDTIYMMNILCCGKCAML